MARAIWCARRGSAYDARRSPRISPHRSTGHGLNRRPLRVCALVAILLPVLAACAPEAGVDLEADVPTWTGSVGLEIGRADGAAPYLLGQVSGIEVDARSRICVADALAHGEGGGWAEALGSVYEIRWFEPDGQARPTIRVPERKPPLVGLHLDAEGRLWVERSVTADEDRRAEVFGPDGRLVARATWPAGVSLGPGLIRGQCPWPVPSTWCAQLTLGLNCAKTPLGLSRNTQTWRS